jgi:hypothetical protein
VGERSGRSQVPGVMPYMIHWLQRSKALHCLSLLYPEGDFKALMIEEARQVDIGRGRAWGSTPHLT